MIRLPSSEGGPAKLRPALVLALLPGAFQNVLICGISSRLQGLEPGWDEVIGAKDKDFAASGLHRASSIRLSYLYAAEAQEIAGVIGSIDRSRLERLLARLASRLKS